MVWQAWAKGTSKEFDLVLAGEEALCLVLERERSGLLAATAEQLRDEMAPHLSPTDSEALTAGLAEYFHSNMAHGTEEGADGWVDDNLAFVKPWGFELSALDRPVLVVQGGDDLMRARASTASGSRRTCRAASRGSTTRDGHLTLAEHLVPEVHDWLQSHS